MNRVIHELQQGSPEWHAYRRTRYNASDAPAMLGKSRYVTRTELLAQYAIGTEREISADTQRRFDDGHAYEAAARGIAEGIIGEELFPVTMSIDYDGLPLSASFDGLDMAEEIAFEHKSLNADLEAALGQLDRVRAGAAAEIKQLPRRLLREDDVVDLLVAVRDVHVAVVLLEEVLVELLLSGLVLQLEHGAK